MEGGQSWPQPPFRRPEPAESRLRAELPALQLARSLLPHDRVPTYTNNARQSVTTSAWVTMLARMLSACWYARP